MRASLRCGTPFLAALACATAMVSTVWAEPSAPLQPFTVELLDLNRGEWEFLDALGQWLHLDGPVHGMVSDHGGGPVGVTYLCCDPEFPEDPGRGSFREAKRVDELAGSIFRIEEPFLSCTVAVDEAEGGVRRVELSDIDLGPAMYGDSYVSALYIATGDLLAPVWLRGTEDTALRLTTDRVGHVFAAPEMPRISLVSFPGTGGVVRLEARDLATGKEVWRERVDLGDAAESVGALRVEVPLMRFGVFEVTATTATSPPASLRVCRVPAPRHISPDDSRIGINLFQQQIWWYAYQVPLMAKAGAHWIRPWLHWENAWAKQQPEPEAWDMRPLEAALRRTRAFGQRYIPILFFAPEWLSGTTEWSAPPTDRMDVWSDYVERLVGQFRGDINYWEIWNEPDLMWPVATRDQGTHYVEVLKAAFKAAKRADPDCTVLGLSHAGSEEWLKRVADMEPQSAYDIATVHSYATSADIVGQIEARRAILDAHGEAKPLWLNEFGAPAYDFSPEYSARFNCSEQSQAAALTSLYALALSLNDDAKAFWFCTYDPRDAAHESQWTGDAGIGVLYLGFLPKLSYAALAGVAHELDGRRCLGRAALAQGLQQVSFEGPVTVLWSDVPTLRPTVAATAVGCLPDEEITVSDSFTNELAHGLARDIVLSLDAGPIYIEGSQQMAAIARAGAATWLNTSKMESLEGGSVECSLTAPQGAQVSLAPTPDGVDASVSKGAAGQWTIRLTSGPSGERAWGVLRVEILVPAGILGLKAPLNAERAVAFAIGAPNLIRDGAFELGNTAAWSPEPGVPVQWDPDVGHSSPGALRLDGPAQRRLVHWGIEPQSDRGVELGAWVRLQGEGAVATVHLAFFGGDDWLGTADLATVTSAGATWQYVEASLTPEEVPDGVTRAAFHIDADVPVDGALWLDDVDLWQPPT